MSYLHSSRSSQRLRQLCNTSQFSTNTQCARVSSARIRCVGKARCKRQTLGQWNGAQSQQQDLSPSRQGAVCDGKSRPTQLLSNSRVRQTARASKLRQRPVNEEKHSNSGEESRDSKSRKGRGEVRSACTPEPRQSPRRQKLDLNTKGVHLQHTHIVC